MKDNSELIEKYLLGELNEVEKASFESKLINDSQLAEELEAQKLIMNASLKEGVKSAFEKERNRRVKVRKMITWTSLAAALIIGFGIFTWIKSSNSFDSNVAKQNEAFPSIKPPLAKLDKPLQHYSFHAEKGDTIISTKGSAICFPASSLVDASGNIVSGSVDVFFREFNDLLDIYLSGIPMQYDSGGVKYNFESAAMCEIRVSKNGKPLYVNQDKKPQVLLTATVADSRFNLYQFDTVKKNWINKGKDKLIAFDEKPISNSVPIATIQKNPSDFSTNESTNQEKPVKPTRAEEGKPKFEVAIEDYAFQELKVYDGLKFQVVDINNYNPDDANEHWDNMELKPTSTPGIYRIEFVNSKRTVSYRVKPVLNEEDYAEAMKVFQQKRKDYDAALSKRKRNEINYADSIANLIVEMKNAEIKDSTEVAEYNAIVNKRNQEMKLRNEEEKRRLDSLNRIDAINNLDVQKFYEEIQSGNEVVEVKIEQEIYRGFAIDGFGYWNIDCPHYEPKAEYIALSAKSNKDSILNLSSVALVKQGSKIIQNVELMNMVLVDTKADYFVWGLRGEEIWFVDYKNYGKTPLTGKTKTLTFRKLDAEISDYEHLRRMIQGSSS